MPPQNSSTSPPSSPRNFSNFYCCFCPRTVTLPTPSPPHLFGTGKNHKTFSRHLGKIVRDHNICPLRVHSWKEIGEAEKNHMWAAVMDKFQNKEMEIYQDVTLEHMNELWNKWRGDLHRKFIKPCENMQEALKIVPEGVDREDWEWLVKEHFFSENFLAASKRNSENRAKLHAKFCETEKKNQSLKSRMDGMEAELQKIKEMLQQHHNTPPPPSPSEGN